MKQYRTLLVIVVIVALALWVVLADRVGFGDVTRETTTRLGLDLVGGVQVLLEGEIPEGMSAAEQDTAMNTVRTIVENRVNGLGVSEAVVVRAGDKRIVVELPGVEDPEQARETIKQTALLEFVDMSSIPQSQAYEMQLSGVQIATDYNPGNEITATATMTNTGVIWHTIMTGAHVKSAGVTTNQSGQYEVAFELNNEGSQIFGDFTASHTGQVLAIVLDKQIISAPTISNAILGGQGVITGKFTYDEAQTLAVQISYGALPIPLKEVETRTIGPSLGQDSLDKSLVAGIIGFVIVILFMGLYYRLPGVVADIAIIIYAILTFALYQYMPVVLTLPGIAGFLLSTGSALDANILIFERMKEELREGRSLQQAIRLGWDRAWPSIRDSNIATLITCTILYFFGSTSGATIVKGFSITLLVGIFVSLFTAIFVTRNFLTLVLTTFKPANLQRWFGI
ncbi:MAG: protein translocase subunit SecD [Chloroflexota bacterium]